MRKLPFKIDLTDKVAVVTGGTGVLGGQFVDALAACGAKVAVLGRKLEDTEKKAKEVQAKWWNCHRSRSKRTRQRKLKSCT